MGMDPATIYAIAAIAGPALASMFGPDVPEGQELKSFENTQMDPEDMGTDLRGMLGYALENMYSLAEQPVTIRTTAPNLPSFSGGGLPMPISVPAGDPNRMNPALRTIPGGIQRRSLSELAGQSGTGSTPTGSTFKTTAHPPANIQPSPWGEDYVRATPHGPGYIPSAEDPSPAPAEDTTSPAEDTRGTTRIQASGQSAPPSIDQAIAAIEALLGGSPTAGNTTGAIRADSGRLTRRVAA